MLKFVLTIRVKLLFAFGIAATIMLMTGLVGFLQLCYGNADCPVLFRSLAVGLVCMAAIGCPFVTFAGFHLHKLVCGGMDRQRKKYAEIATTMDLSMRSSSPRMDEFGQNAREFDKLLQRMQETISLVRASTEAVATATREIAAGNMDLSTRTEAQAASLEETAATMMQLTGTVKQNATHARDVNDLASNATGIAATGAFERIPHSLKLCFAHGGGSFAFLLGRVDNAWRERDIVRENCPQVPSSYVDRFSVDSAVFEPAALKLLVDVMGEERVLLGSDYPYPLGEKQVGRLIDTHPGLSKRAKARLCGENAQQFFGLPVVEAAA